MGRRIQQQLSISSQIDLVTDVTGKINVINVTLR